MRILLVNDYTVPTGGAELMVLALRDGLRSRGHVVRVFGGTGFGASLWPGPSFADATCLTVEGRMQALSSVWNLSARRRLRRMIEEFRPDVVHVTMFLWQLSPSILALLRDVPAIFHAVMYKSVCPTGMKQLPGGSLCRRQWGTVCLREGCLSPPRWLAMMLQQRLWRSRRRSFNVIVVPSRAVHDELVAGGLGPVQIIPNGCAIGVRRPPLKNPPVVAFAGRLSKEKGVDTLIRAFTSMPDPPAEAELWIAGDGPEAANLRALASCSSPSRSIRFLGAIERSRLDEAFESVWVQAVPSTWKEPFGLVSVESMARGTAVVAGDVGGLKEIVRHNETGLLLPPGDIAAWRDALASLLNDRERCERMGAAGRVVAEREFDIERYFTAIEALCVELAAGEKRDGA